MRKFAESFIGAWFGVLLIAVFIPVFFPFLSELEGKYLPVVDGVGVFNIHQDGEWTILDIRFNKKRNCEFDGLVWYRFSAGNYIKIPIDFPDSVIDESDQSRDTGIQWGHNWRLKMSPEDLKLSKAEVRHYCHFLWRTPTHFFPPVPD